tara:strand:+ start:961 stop:1524 length:564 start_codon:yes stop_codon:yes gene_type:complete
MVVTKKRSVEDVEDLIDRNFTFFGENRVQEAQSKYSSIKSNRSDYNLHLIGPLQSNKTKQALSIFDGIQSIDRKKIIDEIQKLNHPDLRCKEFFIQINIGREPQKHGVMPEEIEDLYYYALHSQMKVKGLMCIPPDIDDPSQFFEEMNTIKNLLNPSLLLSMGMSNDYKIALSYNSNIIRIGSMLFE